MKNKTRPFSIRLSDEERARLERQAAGLSLGTYIRSRLLDGADAVRRTRGKFPVADHQALAQLLGKLGTSRLADSVSQIAYAARTGVLPLSPETEAALCKACADVAEMKHLLMKALGIKER